MGGGFQTDASLLLPSTSSFAFRTDGAVEQLSPSHRPQRQQLQQQQQQQQVHRSSMDGVFGSPDDTQYSYSPPPSHSRAGAAVTGGIAAGWGGAYHAGGQAGRSPVLTALSSPKVAPSTTTSPGRSPLHSSSNSGYHERAGFSLDRGQRSQQQQQQQQQQQPYLSPAAFTHPSSSSSLVPSAAVSPGAPGRSPTHQLPVVVVGTGGGGSSRPSAARRGGAGAGGLAGGLNDFVGTSVGGIVSYSVVQGARERGGDSAAASVYGSPGGGGVLYGEGFSFNEQHYAAAGGQGRPPQQLQSPPLLHGSGSGVQQYFTGTLASPPLHTGASGSSGSGSGGGGSSRGGSAEVGGFAASPSASRPATANANQHRADSRPYCPFDSELVTVAGAGGEAVCVAPSPPSQSPDMHRVAMQQQQHRPAAVEEGRRMTGRGAAGGGGADDDARRRLCDNTRVEQVLLLSPALPARTSLASAALSTQIVRPPSSLPSASPSFRRERAVSEHIMVVGSRGGGESWLPPQLPLLRAAVHHADAPSGAISTALKEY